MQSRDSIYDWSIPCGTWARLRVRISPLFLLVVAVLAAQRWDDETPFLAAARLATLFGICLFAAVLLHELAHLVALRLTGGRAAEAVLWPLGGVARHPSGAPQPAPVAVALAGPLMNLAVAAVCLPVLLRSAGAWSVLNPLALPPVDLDGRFAEGLLAFTFFANWIVVLANVLPALPLSGGRILDSVLAARFGSSLGQQMLFRAGLSVGFVVVVAALLAESVWLCAVGAGLVAYNLREALRQQIAETYDESFMGYDFSQGYTSLERSVPVETETKPGLIQRWLARRRASREERQRQRAEEAERELDILLAKVHTYGVSSLTDAERRTLKRASARYRGRTKS